MAGPWSATAPASACTPPRSRGGSAWGRRRPPHGAAPGDGRRDCLLVAGRLEPRKGIDDLIAAWRRLRAPRPRLILCGDRGWRTHVPDEIEVTGYVSRERLRELYRGAMGFIYPSH